MRRSSAAARRQSPAGLRPPAQVREQGLRACSLCVAALFALGPLGCGADGEAAGAGAATASGPRAKSAAKPADPRATKSAADPAANSAAKPATNSAASPDPRDASAEPKPASAEGAAGGPTAKPERSPSATPRAAGRDDHDDHGGDDPRGASAPPPAVEPRAEQLRDLETLCAALNRDYVDGTLTDYYHDLTMKTGFGKDLRRRGEESMKPGRILESGRAKLGENAGDPPLPACAQLFDELDDLE